MNEEWCVGYEEGKMDALKEIEAEIEAAVLAEREACAKVCDDKHDYMCSRAAAEIRARGEK